MMKLKIYVCFLRKDKASKGFLWLPCPQNPGQWVLTCLSSGSQTESLGAVRGAETVVRIGSWGVTSLSLQIIVSEELHLSGHPMFTWERAEFNCFKHNLSLKRVSKTLPGWLRGRDSWSSLSISQSIRRSPVNSNHYALWNELFLYFRSTKRSPRAFPDRIEHTTDFSLRTLFLNSESER